MGGLEPVEGESPQPQGAILAEQGGGQLLSLGVVAGGGLVLAQRLRLVDVVDVRHLFAADSVVRVQYSLLPRAPFPQYRVNVPICV